MSDPLDESEDIGIEASDPAVEETKEGEKPDSSDEEPVNESETNVEAATSDTDEKNEPDPIDEDVMGSSQVKEEEEEDILNLSEFGIEDEPESDKSKKPKNPDEKKPRKMTAAEKRRFDLFYDVQLSHYQKREKTVEIERTKKAKEFAQKYTFTPKTGKRKKDEERRSPNQMRQSFLMWNQDKNNRIEAARLKKKEDELNGATFKPAISNESRKLLKQDPKKKYDNPVKGWEKRFRKFQDKRKEPTVDRTSFSPKLSKGTRKLTETRGKAPIHERLYVDSIALSREKKAPRDGQEKPKFQPRVGTTKFGKKLKDDISREKNVFDDLFTHSKVRTRKIVEMQKRAEDEKVYSHKPQISRISREIAKVSTKRKPLYVSPKKSPKKDMGSSGEKPKTPSNRSRRSSGKSTGSARSSPKTDRAFERIYERNKKFIEQKKAKMEEVLRLRREEEDKHCSFKPQISTSSKKLAADYKFDFGRHKPKNVRGGNSGTEEEKQSPKRMMWRIVSKEGGSDDIRKGEDQPAVKDVGDDGEGEEREKMESVKSQELGDDDTETESEEEVKQVKKKKKGGKKQGNNKKRKSKEESEDEDDISEELKLNFEGMGEIEDEIDNAFDDWEKLSSNFDF